MTLPLTGHMSGRAAPLPAPTPEAPAAQPEPKAAEPPRAVIPEDTSDAPDIATVLTGEPAAEDIAAAAGCHRRAAALATESAERDRAEAEQLLEDAQREAARIIDGAKAEALPLVTSAGDAEMEAAELAERAERLVNAATAAVNAEAAAARVQALEDERAELAAQAAELDGRLAELAGRKRDLEPQLAAATDCADLDLMTGLRNKLDSIGVLEETLRTRRAPLLARVAEIGAGDETFATHPLLKVLPLLAKARQAAASGQSSVRTALNLAFPERPEAVADAAREEFRLTIEAQRGRIAEEAAAQRKPPPPRAVVHL
jgi:hypothetical protein